MTKQPTQPEQKEQLTSDITPPDKFKGDNGEINVPVLLKSYLELEKKMSDKKSQNELFIELAQPDKNGVSRWVFKTEFTGKYKELMFLLTEKLWKVQKNTYLCRK